MFQNRKAVGNQKVPESESGNGTRSFRILVYSGVLKVEDFANAGCVCTN